jgi:hypothetical protein
MLELYGEEDIAGEGMVKIIMAGERGDRRTTYINKNATDEMLEKRAQR